MSLLREYIDKIFKDTIYRAVLSGPRETARYKKLNISLIEGRYQIEKLSDTQAFHQWISAEDLPAFFKDKLETEYKQLNCFGEVKEYQIKMSKREKALYSEVAAKKEVKVKTQHNREKRYLLPEGTPIPPLVDMGIFTKEGRVIRSMMDKYRQINRFLELMDDEVHKLSTDKHLHVIDFGCGKSYLTFILYYYLTEIQGMNVSVTGLDLKSDVIARCNKTAEKYGYSGLHFEVGDIKGYTPKKPVDMVLTLHACDTATDHALSGAVQWGAKLIFSVPCCQHELFGQMKSDNFSALTKYGTIKERVAALMTDSIRGSLLEYCGYKVQLLEFVDFSHTPKNILIRAKKTSSPRKVEALREVDSLCREFHLDPCLYRLLCESGYIK